MSAMSWVRLIADRIAHKIQPRKIILFGSYAYGRPGKDSDLDILVILKKTIPREKRYRLVGRAIGEHLYPLDVLMRSEKEIKERLQARDSFIEEIIENGKVLYET